MACIPTPSASTNPTITTQQPATLLTNQQKQRHQTRVKWKCKTHANTACPQHQRWLAQPRKMPRCTPTHQKPCLSKKELEHVFFLTFQFKTVVLDFLFVASLMDRSSRCFVLEAPRKLNCQKMIASKDFKNERPNIECSGNNARAVMFRWAPWHRL